MFSNYCCIFSTTEFVWTKRLQLLNRVLVQDEQCMCHGRHFLLTDAFRLLFGIDWSFVFLESVFIETVSAESVKIRVHTYTLHSITFESSSSLSSLISTSLILKSWLQFVVNPWLLILRSAIVVHRKNWQKMLVKCFTVLLDKMQRLMLLNLETFWIKFSKEVLCFGYCCSYPVLCCSLCVMKLVFI